MFYFYNDYFKDLSKKDTYSFLFKLIIFLGIVFNTLLGNCIDTVSKCIYKFKFINLTFCMFPDDPRNNTINFFVLYQQSIY